MRFDCVSRSGSGFHRSISAIKGFQKGVFSELVLQNNIGALTN